MNTGRRNDITRALITSLAVVLIQLVYSRLFGKENVLVGTMIGMATASFLNRDFTLKLLYKTFTFLILNLILGIMSYLASINLYLGIIVNLATIFTVTYIYMNDFRTPTSYIFLMGYIYIWSSPITLYQLPKRLFALTFGIVIIMLAQYVLNKNNFFNITRDILISISKDIENELEGLLNKDYESKKSININKKIRKLLILLNDRSYRKFYSSTGSKIVFNIVISLERLNIITNEMKKDVISVNFNHEFIFDLIRQIKNIRYILENEDLNLGIDIDFSKFIYKYKQANESYVCEAIYSIEILEHNIKNLSKLNNQELNKVNRSIKIPKEFKKLNRAKQNLNFESILFVYSLKLAIVISMAMFIIDYSNIPYGKWIVLTIYVLMQPYSEDTRVKAKKRLKGTILGVIIFLLGFSFIHYSIPKLIVLFVAFFFYFYYKEYDKKVIGMTIVSLISVSLTENINILSINRLIYVTIGITIVVLFDRIVFPYNIYDSIRDLKRKYIRLIRMIREDIKNTNKTNESQDKLIKLILICSEIEEKLIANNKRVNDDNLETFIFEKCTLLSDIRYFILQSYYIDKGYIICNQSKSKMISDIIKKIDNEI